jgi:hypothetical protein
MANLTPAKFASEIGMQVDAVYKAVQDGRLGSAVRRQGRRVFIDLELGREALRGFRKKTPALPSPPVGEEPRLLGEHYAGESLDESLKVEKSCSSRKPQSN